MKDQIVHWKGIPIEDCSREQLIAAIYWIVAHQQLKDKWQGQETEMKTLFARYDKSFNQAVGE